MPSIARRMAARAHRFSWRMRAISLLLCLVTWRGPLPWLHEHETDPQATASDPALTRHVTHYHALSHEVDEGWHVHLLLPFGRCPCPDPDDDSSATQDPLSFYGTLLTKSATAPAPNSVSSTWCCVPAAGSWNIAVSIAAIQTHPPPNRPTSFLGSLLAAAPLRAVTGVALC